jgi:N-acetylglutamate synthase-like GNAT family acetyltransferase
MYSIRKARIADDQHIQKLIRQSHINPTGLDWRRFLVAADTEDLVIGCGQIKPHKDGSKELASVAVVPEWRHQGVASAIIRQLLRMDAGELFLICRSALGTFYEQFGFHAIEQEAMPPYFRRINRLARWVKRLEKNGEGFLVMRRASG